ncbi:ABC transporter ATP-binding protein [Pediococcus ethanolidurans]|nr:ABC transporter ATP-binding protein [Pediococcus ethanolidurans]
MVNTILKEADLFCPNSVRINFTIYHKLTSCISVKLGKLKTSSVASFC